PDQMQHLDAYMNILQDMVQTTSGIRRAGSAALDLAWVAAGRLDGFWEFGLSSWDIAAGTLLIREAGGLVSDLAGGSNYLDSGNIVAANPKLFKAMLQSFQPHLTDVLMRLHLWQIGLSSVPITARHPLCQACSQGLRFLPSLPLHFFAPGRLVIV